jgi:D-glycero-D-manno-heptose 1,7-bisphosphate phosphatase
MTLVEHGLWCSIAAGDFVGRRALFLDRDGVVVEDTDYLGRADDVCVIPGAADAIARCNRHGVPVVLITNQSGIGRGKYGWQGFQAVQGAISVALEAAGGRFDGVLACAYHADATGKFRIADHVWRKPKPGMILEAVRQMRIDAAGSWMVGDRASDIEAGRAAGLAGGVLVLTGNGANDIDAAFGHASHDYAVETAPNLGEAIATLIAHGRLQI